MSRIQVTESKGCVVPSLNPNPTAHHLKQIACPIYTIDGLTPGFQAKVFNKTLCPQKATYYMIPVIRKVQNRQIHTDRKLNNGCDGLGTGEEWGVTASRNQTSLGENENTTLELDKGDGCSTL